MKAEHLNITHHSRLSSYDIVIGASSLNEVGEFAKDGIGRVKHGAVVGGGAANFGGVREGQRLAGFSRAGNGLGGRFHPAEDTKADTDEPTDNRGDG